MARYCGYHGKEIKPPTPAYWCSSCNWYVCWECQSHHHGHGYCPSCGNRTTRVNQGGGGCFVTTATLLATGKTVDCFELDVFRNFRDNWLLGQENGKEQVGMYYQYAPTIVDAINSRTDSMEIYSSIWNNDLKPCYDLILVEKFEEAKQRYLDTVLKLMELYVPRSSQSKNI